MKPHFTLSKLLLALTIVLLISLSANAQKIPFQGKLLENGEPVDGQKTLVFSIADPVWSETHENVQVTNGLYSLVLGSITDLPAGLFDGVESLSLNVSVDGTALTPVEIYAPISKSAFSYDVDLTTGNANAVSGIISGTGDGFNTRHTGVYGEGNALTGDNTGVYGKVNVSTISEAFNIGVLGEAYADPNGFNDGFAYGVRGQVGLGAYTGAVGVRGISSNTTGNSGFNEGGYFSANNNPTRNRGVLGIAQGDFNTGGTSENYGVWGQANNASSAKNIGVYGLAANSPTENWAGWFEGNAKVTGDLTIDGVLNATIDMSDNNEFSTTYDPNDTEAKPALSGFANGTPMGYNDGGTPNDPSDDLNIQAVAIRGTAESDGYNIGVEGIANHSVGNGEFQVGVYGRAGGDGEGIKYGLRGDLSGSNSGFTVAVRGLNAADGVPDGVSYGAWFDTRGTGATGMRNYGVRGTANKNAGQNIGVYGNAFNGDSNYAGWFDGDVQINANQMGLGKKDWEPNPERPYFTLRGTTELEDTNNPSCDDPNTPETEFCTYYPDMIWMEVTDDGEGNEMGAISLRSADGKEFRIDANGLGDLSASKAEGEFRVESEGQGRAFLFAAYDEGQDVRWGGMNLNSPSDLDNIRFGYKTWETNKELPYFRINGDWEVDNGSGEMYRPDLVWMNVSQWEDNGSPTEQLGEISFRSTSGAEFGINAYGFTGIVNNVDAKGYSLFSNRLDIPDGGGGTYKPTLGRLEVHEWGDDTNTPEVEPEQDVAHINLEAIDTNGDVISSFGMNAYGFTGIVNNVDAKGYSLISNRFDIPDGGGGTYKPTLGRLEVHEWGDDTNTPEIEPEQDVAHINLEAIDASGNVISSFGLNAYGFTSNIENLGVNGNIDLGNLYDPNESGVQISSNGNVIGNYFEILGDQQVTGDYLPGLVSIGYDNQASNGNAGWLALRHSNSGANEVESIRLNGDNGSASFAGNINVGDYLNANSNLEGGGANTNNGGNINLGGLSETTGIRMYGEFVDGDLNSVSHLALDGTSGNYVHLWGNGGIGATGDINTTANMNATAFNTTSDKRLKTNILPLNNALSNVMKMRGVSYNWIDKSRSEQLQIGVIAQEVEEVYPEFVHTNDEGMKSVNYSQMVAVLIEAIKELNTKISTLETENASLKASLAEVDGLKSQMKNLETLVAKLVQNDAVTTTTQQQ